jgi:hypothetical protein
MDILPSFVQLPRNPDSVGCTLRDPKNPFSVNHYRDSWVWFLLKKLSWLSFIQPCRVHYSVQLLLGAYLL